MKIPLSLYWDSSAVVSLFIADPHTQRARKAAHPDGLHVLSSLAVAEVFSVFSRKKLDELARRKEEFGRELDEGKWSFNPTTPSLTTLKSLSDRHPLRGADLWHLAKALELREEIPELRIITFDDLLSRSARREGCLYEVGS